METPDSNYSLSDIEPTSVMSPSQQASQRNLEPSAFADCPANLAMVPRDAGRNDDDDLQLDRVARRAEGALESLYHTVSPRLYAVALRMLGDEGDAQEAVQDAFVRIWERAPTYNPTLARPFTWMVMILRGLCLDRLRKRHVRRDVAVKSWGISTAGQGGEAHLDTLASPGDAFLRTEILDALRHAFETLPKSDQALLNRILFTPAEINEVADDLGQPVGTVKSRIHRAVTKLRLILRWDHEKD